MKNFKYILLIIGLLIGTLIGYFISQSNINSSADLHIESSADQHWTCSMHPQIDLPEFGPCPICGMDLIPMDNSSDGLDANQFKMTENAMALANIETTTVGESEISSEGGLVLTGKISENEKGNALQTAHFAGRIEKLYISSTGETVKRGQLLALIYSPELVSTQGELLTALEMKNSQPNLYNAVRTKLKLWKLSESQINKIESSKKVITDFPVYANVSGVVTEKMVDQGNHVKEGEGLFKIANLSTVWANFDAYEKQLSAIKKGDKISITTNANPNEEILATISFIDPVLNSSTRTVTVRAVLNNKNGTLKPGMFVQGVLESNSTNTESSTVVSVPKSAVLWTGKRSVVYVKQEGDEAIFEMREVTLGNELNSNYEVLSGLMNGEEVVTNGTFTVDAAAQLSGKRSMMNQDKDASNEEETNEDAVTVIEVDKKFKQQLGAAVIPYIKLKDALVKSDAMDAIKNIQLFESALDKIDMSLLNTDAHTIFMKAVSEIKKYSEEIKHNKEIDLQRAAFGNLNKDLLNVINTFGIEMPNNKPVYLDFCPMADNNKGSYWLSFDKEINNPYFGDAMLRCGEIKKTFTN